MKFAQRVIPDPIIIRLKRNQESLANIKQFYVECKSKEDKFDALSNLYGTVSIGQAMIFCHVSWTIIEHVIQLGVYCLSGEVIIQRATLKLLPTMQYSVNAQYI